MRRSDRDALAALGAARVDHRAACSRLHACAKAVGLLAVGRRRLESTFHFGGTLRLPAQAPEKHEIIADSWTKRHATRVPLLWISGRDASKISHRLPAFQSLEKRPPASPWIRFGRRSPLSS